MICDLVAVNHLEAHALTVGLTENLRPPYLLLLISGGHTQLLIVHDVGRYERLGTTIDDALGEAFDKTAKLLGLGFPGGPAVERAAAQGKPGRFELPRPMLGRPEPHFSFAGPQDRRAAPGAGVGAADRRRGRRPVRGVRGGGGGQRRRPGAARDRHRRRQARAGRPAPGRGGRRRGQHAVAGRRSPTVADQCGYTLHVPPAPLCTDNAAMVAWAGAERLARGWPSGSHHPGARPLAARSRRCPRARRRPAGCEGLGPLSPSLRGEGRG